MQDYVSGEDISEDEAYIVQDTEGEDPIFFDEAVKCTKWRQAMDAEINSIIKNKTWTLTDLPAHYKTIGVKWIYKTKRDEKGDIVKHKARLVAKGYSQKEGIDYTEVYAPVARMDTVRMIISVAAHKGWKIMQLDVKSAFLHRELIEDVYVEQPRGYESKGKKHMVYKLHKALYGLKQAPRAWFSRIERHFLDEGFEENRNEHTLFTKRSKEGRIVIVSLYVDDLIITGDDEELIAKFKSSLIKQFDMTDLGGMSYFLGIHRTKELC
ncbi:transmembrane signal receptor [Lithospermum erythrorhizon]|uniref:Transmembrane signal receptor n=1 Tax=Lithospermum erythrorhizon TaxID=34254 RepID=A0AAV3P7V6_LITER